MQPLFILLLSQATPTSLWNDFKNDNTTPLESIAVDETSQLITTQKEELLVLHASLLAERGVTAEELC